MDRRRILAVTALVPFLLVGVAPATAHAAKPSDRAIEECNEQKQRVSDEDCDY